WWDLHNFDSIALLTRYRWQDTIRFEVDARHKVFVKDMELIKAHAAIERRSALRDFVIKAVYFFLKPRRKIKLFDLLACPHCKSELRQVSADELHCAGCDRAFKKMSGYFDFRVMNGEA